jgi:hypothetical protein
MSITIGIVTKNIVLFSMKDKDTVQKKQSGVRLPAEMLKSLKHLSIDLERSLTSLLTEAAADLLKKYEKKKPKG